MMRADGSPRRRPQPSSPSADLQADGRPGLPAAGGNRRLAARARRGGKTDLPQVNYDVGSSPIKGTFIRLPVMFEKVPTRQRRASGPRAPSLLMQALSNGQITPSLSRPEDARTHRFCTVRKFVMRRIADSL